MLVKGATEHMIRVKFISTSCEIAIGLMPQDTIDDNKYCFR